MITVCRPRQQFLGAAADSGRTRLVAADFCNIVARVGSRSEYDVFHLAHLRGPCCSNPALIWMVGQFQLLSSPDEHVQVNIHAMTRSPCSRVKVKVQLPCYTFLLSS